MNSSSSHTVLTGVKPTDRAHIGNYLGAIRPAIELANSSAGQSLLFVADYHAITTVHKASEMKQFTLDLAATWLACGLDPKKTIIYRQSDIPEIFELAWVLSCFTPKGFMNRAHAYKARIQENEQAGKKDLDTNVSMGLFSYPVLMSADILMFDADKVPVGDDQIQHVEFARDIAGKFNHNYGPTLKLPEFVVNKNTKTVPGLDGRKMSKSYGNHIPIFEDPKKLRSLVMKVKTDSLPPEAPKDPETSLIMQLFKEFATPEQVTALSDRFTKGGMGYGEAKEALFNAIDTHLAPKRDVYTSLMNDPAKINAILKEGAQRARQIAGPVMARVRTAIGV